MQDQEDWLACPLESLHFLPSDNSTSDHPLSDPWSSPEDDLWLPNDVPPSHGSQLLQIEIPALDDSDDTGKILHQKIPLPPPRPQHPRLSALPFPCTLSPSSSTLPPSKLTLGQKLDIVRRSEAPKHSLEYCSPSQLARMYGKSRSSISKILRPSYVRRLRQLEASGVSRDIRRSTSTLHPELERRIHEYVAGTARGANWRQEVCRYAEGVARELGVEGFKASMNWYHRFIARHSLRSGAGSCGRGRVESWEGSLEQTDMHDGRAGDETAGAG